MKIEIQEIQQLLNVIEEKNLSIKEVILLISGTRESFKTESLIDEDRTITLDYTRDYEGMLLAGNYARIDDAIIYWYKKINTRWSPQNNVEKPIRLFHFNKTMTSDEVIKEIDKEGYVPGTLLELLALGEKYMYLQRQFPIIALGSVKHDGGRNNQNRRISGLSVTTRERTLEVVGFNKYWETDFRFLATPK